MGYGGNECAYVCVFIPHTLEHMFAMMKTQREQINIQGEKRKRKGREEGRKSCTDGTAPRAARGSRRGGLAHPRATKFPSGEEGKAPGHA